MLNDINARNRYVAAGCMEFLPPPAADLSDEFIIDGTGQVIRLGDEVYVRELLGVGGKAIVQSINRQIGWVTVESFSGPMNVSPTRIRRTDDTDRTPGGDPLWVHGSF